MWDSGVYTIIHVYKEIPSGANFFRFYCHMKTSVVKTEAYCLQKFLGRGAALLTPLLDTPMMWDMSLQSGREMPKVKLRKKYNVGLHCSLGYVKIWKT